MRKTVVLFLSYLFCIAAGSQEIYNANPSVLANKVIELTELSLKYNEMQGHLDTLSYQRQTLQGTALLNALSDSFSAKFQSRVEAVKHLRDAVVSSYTGTTSSAKRCCDLTSGELEHDTRFKQPASTSTVCELVSSNAPSNAIRLQNAFRDACVDNLRSVPSMKWQYFGSEQGVTTQFPATVASNCGSFDNRFRPWYVQSNVPKPKQIVIVIDKSGSMNSIDVKGNSYMELARQAATTVINTTNPYDEFAVVSFSTTADVYSDTAIPNGNCFRSTFAQATPQNRKRVNDYIGRISAGGVTNFIQALDAAFNFFDNLGHTALADRAILFMSDGEPSEPNKEDIITVLNTRNARLGNSVVVMTYGLGPKADSSILRRMAQSTQVEVGTSIKDGTYIAITEPSNLRNEMASYYNFFSVKGQPPTDPIWTVPYLDGWGLGLMITASLPVYVGGNLAGVAAVDITIEELLAESSFFQPTELSYSFVINEAGLIINHPNFPYVTDSDPLFVQATAFERDAEFLSVFESMKRGESGNKTFTSTRILPAGDSKMYGVRTVSVRSNYFWKQIPGTNFSLCLVLAAEDQQTVLAPQGSLKPGEFLYHRFDLVPPKQQCRHVRSFCAKDKSSVTLAARSFKDPDLYVFQNNSVAYVKKLTDYIEGASSDPANLKSGVKNDIVATYKANELWVAAESDGLNKEVFWRFLATKDGMFRIFPGTQLPSNFDPVTRSWYEHALANRDKYVITPPYRDASSAVSVITLTKTLFEGKPGGVHNTQLDKPIGAMGVDLVTAYFEKLLGDLYPLCNQTSLYKCLLIDNGGFVITAPEFTSKPQEAFNRHIADLEPSIASVLESQNILQKKQCSNIENSLIHETFQIGADQQTYIGNTAYPTCYYFELKPVPGTNAYLIMIKLEYSGTCSSSGSTCYCSSVGASQNKPTCRTRFSSSCSCPCTSYNPVYWPCTNQYKFTSLSPQPCTPEIKDLTQVGTPAVDINSLPICYEISFTVPDPEGSGGSSSLSPGTIAGIVIGCMVGVVIVVVVLYLMCRNAKSAPPAAAVAPKTPTAEAPVYTPPPVNPNYGYGYPGSPQNIPYPSAPQAPGYHGTPPPSYAPTSYP